MKIGDIAIGQNFILDTECNGMECEIIGPLIERKYRCADGERGRCFGYLVKWTDGAEAHIHPKNLRKRPPKLSTWEEVQKITNWSPTEVKERETHTP